LAGSESLEVQDFNHDGLLDLVSYTPELVALRNDSGNFAPLEDVRIHPSPVHADFNGDNRDGFAKVLEDGTVHVYFNNSQATHWMTVHIQGVTNTKQASGAIVEMKSADYYEKKVYMGMGLPFALGPRAEADTIRITWPNGFIQNETHQRAGALGFVEDERPRPLVNRAE